MKKKKPPPPSPLELAAIRRPLPEDKSADWLFAQACTFTAGAALISQIPPASLPEFAFVGRSNVGKSSLLNALTKRKKLANVSHTPGRTQQINFFNLSSFCFLVDLPGYGFASVSKQQHKQWSQLIQHYLEYRPTLRRVFVLIDSRHPLKPLDEAMMAFLNNVRLPYQVVLTKVDKAQPSAELLTALVQCGKKYIHQHPHFLFTTALGSPEKVKSGLDDLRLTIAELITNE